MKTIYAGKALSNGRFFPPVLGQQEELFPSANLTGKKSA